MQVLLLTLSIVLLIFSPAKAQREKTYYVIKSWQMPVEVIPLTDQNRYPEFRDGLVYYRNGKVEFRKLNYSILYGEMHFLAPTGDTLVVSNEQLIKKIMIGENEYYSMPKQGYIEVMTSSAPIQLARKQQIRAIVGGKIPPSGYSQDNTYLGDIPTPWQLYHQKGSILKMLKEVSYVFIDHNQRFYPAKKSVLLKLYPDHRKDIYRYIKTHNIDFKNPEDLQQVIEFIANTLTTQ